MAEAKILDSGNEYSVGWISALAIERAAATAMFDEEHAKPRDFEQSSTDSNSYAWGSISGHNVVIASLPAGSYGTTPAAVAASLMLAAHPKIKFGLMVGIGAGIPSKTHDIRLGDIVVSQPEGRSGGVILHDFKKSRDGGKEERKGFLNSPPPLLLTALNHLKARHDLEDSQVPKFLQSALAKYPKLAAFRPGRFTYLYQGLDHDKLFEAAYGHVDGDDCKNCDLSKAVQREERGYSSPEIHYGNIASGNTLLKGGLRRDDLIVQLGEDCLCIEMEAAGLMNTFPCLVIRGICDYADSHKNNRWQCYASATAAAFAKEFLIYVPGTGLSQMRPAKDTLNEIHSNIGQMHESLIEAHRSKSEKRTVNA